LTAEQRLTVLRELGAQVSASEMPRSDDPQSLARLATRAEMRRPGTIEQTFGRAPAGPGPGGIFLSTLAGAFVGTAIAGAFFDNEGAGRETAATDGSAGDVGQDSAADGDYGDAGSDFGGDDFGGDDFGGDDGF
jgi:hypothetical protein